MLTAGHNYVIQSLKYQFVTWRAEISREGRNLIFLQSRCVEPSLMVNFDMVHQRDPAVLHGEG